MAMEDASAADRVVAEREKDVYFCIRNCRSRGSICQWFRIEGDNNNKVENSSLSSSSSPAVSCSDNNDLFCIFRMPRKALVNFGAVAWKSLIYVFGGINVYRHFRDDGTITVKKDKPLSETFYIDTNCVNDGWHRGPDLLFPRKIPYGVTYQGKIWAMTQSFKPDSYAESLDAAPAPASNWNWILEPMNGGEKKISFILGHAIYSDKIYMYGLGRPSFALHCYDFINQEWSVSEKNFKDFEEACASIDEIMYLVDGHIFEAYDLVNRCSYDVVGLEVNNPRMLPASIYEDNYRFMHGVPSKLLRIGNSKLCLLWISYEGLHCTKFTVSKAYRGDSSKKCFIQANVESFKIYKLPCEGSIGLVAALAVYVLSTRCISYTILCCLLILRTRICNLYAVVFIINKQNGHYFRYKKV